MFDAPVLSVEPGHFYGWQQIVARLGGSEGLTPLALETQRPFGQKTLLLLLSVWFCLHASRHIRRDPRQLGQGSRAITPFHYQRQRADHRLTGPSARSRTQLLTQGQLACHGLHRRLVNLHKQGSGSGREGVAGAVILRQTALKTRRGQWVKSGGSGLQQPAAGQPTRQPRSCRGLPLIIPESTYGKSVTVGFGEIGGLHVGWQPEAELIDEGLTGIEGPLMQHPGLQFDGREGCLAGCGYKSPGLAALWQRYLRCLFRSQ